MRHTNGISHTTQQRDTVRLTSLTRFKPTEWDYPIPVPKLPFKWAALVVFVAAIICFINSHDGHFVFDDSEAIVNNMDLKPETPVWDLFKHDFWGSKLASNTSHKSFRPLTVLTFRFNYMLAGGLSPWGFHVFNIILHGVVSVLVLTSCSIIFAGVSHDHDGNITFGAPRASFLCSLLFAVHPVHTESVAAVVGRADLMCALCFLVSFLCYVISVSTEDIDTEGRPQSFSMPLVLVSMVLCTLSVFFKEQGITVIGICSAYDVIMVCKVDLGQLFGISTANQKTFNGINNNNPQKNTRQSLWVKSLVFRHFILVLSGLVILAIRWWVMGSTTPIFQVVDNPHSFVNGTLLRAINYNYIYAINGWLLLNPWWLCFDWSMGCVPVVESFTDMRVLAAVAFWVVLGSIIFTALKSMQYHSGRVLTMAVVFLCIPFLPGANLFFRVGFVVAERVLYLPSIGSCVLITLGVGHVCRNAQLKQIIQLCLGFIVVVFMVRSVVRSHEWRREITLFNSGANVCPGNAKVHYNLGKITADAGNNEDALARYRLALRLNPEYDQAMNNLANILKEEGQLLEAEQLLEKAVHIRKEFAAAWMNLGIVQAALNKTSPAELSYKTAIVHRNKYPDCYYNLGNLYLNLHRHGDALNAWMNATRLKPTHSISWNNMLILMDNLGKVDMAENIASEAIKHLPNDAAIRFNLANCYGRANRFEESETNFLKAIELDGTDASHYSNLGVLYHRWEKYEKADVAYKQSLRIDPNSQHTKSNYALLQKAMRKRNR